jgi:hypothetical protein
VLFVGWPFHGFTETLANFAEDAFGISDDQCTNSRTYNDHNLERLLEHTEFAAHGHITTKNAGENQDDADNDEHR